MKFQIGLTAFLAVCYGGVAAQTSSHTCGSLINPYGPFDYRSVRDMRLQRVEGAHFPPITEAAIRGKSGPLGADLDYTLRAFPNHHRALVSVMRHGEKKKTAHPSDLRYPVECYFDRALRFRPDDAIARMLYAQFLIRNGRKDDARVHLALVSATADDNQLTHYNLGTAYLELRLYDDALRHAHRAYVLGDVRPELREGLRAAGQWTELPKQGPSTAEEPRTAAGTTAESEAGASDPRQE